MPGRRKGERRVRPGRLDRQRFRQLKASGLPSEALAKERSPSLGLMHVAVGVRASGDERAPPDADRDRGYRETSEDNPLHSENDSNVI